MPEHENDPRSGFAFYVKSPSGIEVALHVSTADLDAVGDLVAGMQEADRLLSEARFSRSDRLDKPVYQRAGGGGGGKRPDTPPPADIIVPECDGQPMKYIPGAKRGDGTDRPPFFVCRAEDACTQKKNGRSNSSFDMKKKAANNGKDAGGSEAQGSATAPTGEMGYGDFLNAALKQFRVDRGQLIVFAKVKNADELKALGPTGWKQILEQLEQQKEAAA